MGKLNTVQNGKGSKPRPMKDIKTYLDNFDSIDWGRKSKETADNHTHENCPNSASTSSEEIQGNG